MIFLSYDFICFALAFFAAYALTGRLPQARLALLILAGLWFQLFYGGVQSLSVAFALALVAYAAGLSKSRPILIAAITICVATLVFFKYTLFLSQNVLGIFIPSGFEEAISSSAPATIPRASASLFLNSSITWSMSIAVISRQKAQEILPRSPFSGRR